MTQETLKKIRALDAAAAEAGGYVIPPWERHISAEKEKKFAELRQRSIREKIPMHILLRQEGYIRD